MNLQHQIFNTAVTPTFCPINIGNPGEFTIRQLGWQPTVPLEQGLEPTIAYFRESLAGATLNP